MIWTQAQELCEMTRCLFSWPHFSITSFKMAKNLRTCGISPRSVIDVGSNIGQFAIAASKILSPATVFCFEPNGDILGTLRKNVQNLNIEVVPLGVGAKSEERTFNKNSHSHSSSFLPLGEHHKGAFPTAVETAVETIGITSLDEYFGERFVERPTLLKLDVQGFEGEVIKGARQFLEKVDYIVVETSFSELYVGEATFRTILSLLEENGFKFVRPVGQLKDPSKGTFIQMDVLFVRKEIG